MNKYHRISLNSQFIVVLDGITCFSVRFCNNSLLVLKMRFQVFPFASKKVQGFSSDMKILMSLLSVLFHLQNCVSVFLNFNFKPRYLRKRTLCPWNQPHFLRNSDKNLLSPEQNKFKKPETCFCRRKTVEDNNSKINVSPNIPYTFLLFKASAFLSEKCTFPIRFENVSFFHSTCLTLLYLFISLLKNIH